MLEHLVPLLLAVPALGSLAVASQDRFLEDDALEPLAASLATYFEARSTGDGRELARSEVATSLAGIAQLLEGGHPLKRPGDLGRALWQSRAYGEQSVRLGKVTEDVFAHGSFAGAGMEYAYRLPKKYDPGQRAYPLILTIPDADEEPADHLRSRWVLREILDGAILVCPAMPEERAEWDRVAVDGRPGGLSHVLTGLRIAAERFAVDFDRVFVAGTGKGVPAAVAAGNTSPQRFAGVIGRAGDAGEQGPENFGNLPTLFTGAGTNATAFQEACRQAGFDNCLLASPGTEEDVWRWMLEHPRRTYPAEVTLVVGQPFPTRAYWLRVAPTAPEAHATATIDRDTNTIKIQSEGVSHVTLYLNDELVNLDAPVNVVCNDVARSTVLSRRLATTLDLLYDGTSDPASVYVVEAFFEAAGEAATSADAGAEATATFGSEGLRFRSQAAFERYLASQEQDQAEARGHVQHKAGWIHADERSLANKGWTKDWPTGQWLSGADEKRLAGDWVRQDLEWIPPDEADHVDEGLWKVDGEWVALEVANRRHAKLDTPWRIPSREVILHSSADRRVALGAMEHMARALTDLRKVFGVEPLLPLSVALLRDEEQYDLFAFGAPDGRRQSTDSGRMHVIHSAYFAESAFQRVKGKLTFAGMGVTYWDPLIPYGDLYGVHSARLAAGLSYADAVDPSPKTVKKALRKGPGDGYHEAYEAEKKLPAWLRYGGAVYAERYFHDSTVKGVEGDNDPWWARRWSLDNLRQRGGLRPLDEVFAFALDPADREDGQKLLLEAGLLAAFMVDGDCAPVTAAHGELKRALASGSVHAKDVEALTQALIENESELRAFAADDPGGTGK